MKGLVTLLFFAVTFCKGAIINRNECSTNASQLLPHENCNQYYQCVNGALIVRNCSSSLYFNPDTEECDWPANVDCGTIEDLNSPDGICRSGNAEGLNFVHDNCNQYYRCLYGNLIEYSCNPNLLFNHENLQCDWPHNVDCTRETQSPDTENPNYTEAPVTESEKPDVEVTSSPDNSDENDNSEDSNEEESSNQDVSSDENSTEEVSSEDKSSDGENISSAEEDKSSIEEDKTSNEEDKSSIEEDNSSVEEDKSSDEEDKSDEDSAKDDSDDDINEIDINKVCSQENSDGQLIPHEDCSKFYKCSEGKPVEMNCPQGLLFNINTEQCDWSENVDCDRDGKLYLKKKLQISVDVTIRAKKNL